MAGAKGNVDQAYGGVPWLNLHDTVDDMDGAGLIEAWATFQILRPENKRDGGNTAAEFGHDYGYMSASSTPAGTWYSEVWNAYVPNNKRLRVVSMMSAWPACGSPPDETNCGSTAMPWHWLQVRDGSTTVASSFNSSNNYQYASRLNNSGAAKTYTIRISPSSWAGIGSTYFAIGWIVE
jgi:hypothetical protein